MIRTVQTTDAAAICAIYNHYVTDTVISFEETPVPVEEMTRRIQDVTKILPWLVYIENDVVTGYAYASTWRARSAYRFAVETTVYVRHDATGQGIGAKLYTELLARLQRAGLHVALGCITIPNEASIALHEKLGFKKVAHFHEVGLKFDRWLDVGYWQLLLENPRGE